MTGQTVSVVEASNVGGFEAGTSCSPVAGWQDYAVVEARHVIKVDPANPRA